MTAKRRINYFRAMTARAFMTVISIIIAVTSAVLLSVFVISPYIKYRLALSALEKGEYSRAVSGFTSLGNYRDSLDMTLECINLRDGLSLDSVTTSELSPWLSVSQDGGVSFISSNYSGDRHVSVPQVIDGRVVTAVADGGFSSSYYITSVELPDTVVSVGERAFAYCTSLREINIPESVTSLGDNAFLSCMALESVSVPDSVSDIGPGVFSNCISLTGVKLPDSMTVVSNSMFLNCASLAEIELGENVRSIAGSAFSGCSSLKSIAFPDSLRYVGSYSFKGCVSLTEVTLPEGVTELGRSVFEECSSLSVVRLPHSLESVGSNVFESCRRLSGIYYRGTPEDWSKINTAAENGVLNSTQIVFQG